MKYLYLDLSNKIKAVYKAKLNNDIIYLNKDFKIHKLLLDGQEIPYRINKSALWQTINVGGKGEIYLEYEGILDGKSGLYPYVKEKTDDDFYILRNETLYYPLEYEMDSKAFLSHYLYPQEEDLFKVEVQINDNRKVLSDLKLKDGAYYGFNPVFIVGDYDESLAFFGKIYHLQLSLNIINEAIDLIKKANELLKAYRDIALKDLYIYIMPEGYGSFVMNNDYTFLFITEDSLKDPHYLIHELTHLHWNPKCNPEVQNVRFFDEAISQFLTLKVLDKMQIKRAEESKNEYIMTYKTYINDYAYSPLPILEYGIKGSGDLSYSFGALALLAIEERVGEAEMTAVLKELIASDKPVDFDIFKNSFKNIDDIWHACFTGNEYADKLLKASKDIE